MSITSSIKSIQDIMRKDVGVDGDAQRIGQLVWLLFLKIFDDREQEWELLDDAYRSPLPEPYRWRNWAADPEGMTGDELKSFIDNELFPSLQKLESYSTTPAAFVVRGVFEDAYNYMKSGQLIRQVINKIQEGVDFNKAQERHAFGDMYEQLLRDLQSAGNAGEFYTPRPVTEFMVRMVDPKLHEKVIDPACGTGGFLTYTIEHKRKHYVKTPEDERVLQASIHGVEKKPLPHLLATTNMILHGIEVPSQIRHDNTLAKPLIGWGPRDRVDCIVANPPFGGMEEDGIETNFPAAFRTRETADLFLVLIMHLLKDGGRAAVVLPDGFLFGEGIKSRIKEKLLTDCNLHTIVRLPNGVFNPYTGIKTNLLFFTKGTPTTDIWFYEHQYPAGVKNYSKTRPMRIEEFATEEAWWGSEADGFAARVEGEFAWKVSAEDIKARNYNLDCKNPHVGEQVSHDPAQLLDEYARVQEGIHGLREQLKSVLLASLTQARDAADFRASWQQLAEHFHTLFTTEASVEALKQTVVHLAVMGKLVAPAEGEASASDFLAEIEAARAEYEATPGLRTRQRADQREPMALPPYPAPPGWEWRNLGSLLLITGGVTLGRKLAGRELVSLPYLRVANVQRGFLVLDQVKEIEVPADEVAKYALAPGDLLTTEGGDWDKVGRTAIWQGEIAKCLHQNHVFRSRPYTDTFSSRWVELYLNSPPARDYFAGSSKQTTNLASINMTQLRACAFPVPPLAEQQRIVAVVDDLLERCDQLKVSMALAMQQHEHLASVLVEQAVA